LVTGTLSEADRHRIQAAAEAAEAQAHVHISVAIVQASDRYALYPVVWGALVALVVEAVIALLVPSMPLRQAFVIEALVFVVVSLFFDWWQLRLRLVPPHIRRSRASVLAHREFAARILAANRESGGVLLFVSLGERYAEVIADRKSHARAGQVLWDKTLGSLIAAAKSQHIADGIISAIGELSSALANES
jgi:putative membrane protein